MNLQEALQTPEVRGFIKGEIEEAVATMRLSEAPGPSELEPLELSEVVADGGSVSARDYVAAQHAVAERVGVATNEARPRGVDLSRTRKALERKGMRPDANASRSLMESSPRVAAPPSPAATLSGEPVWAARMRLRGASAESIKALGWPRR